MRFRLSLPILLAGTLALPAAGQTQSVRIMAANITSGNYQSYEDPGKRIFQGLDPDVVLIQEFNVGNNSSAEIDAFVAEAFGPEFSWFREPGDEQIPNGIVSRWPIVESGQWTDDLVDNRDFAWARIDLPGPTNLWAVSVHLLTSSAAERNLEAENLVAYVQALVPPEDYLVIGGDLNTDTRSESAVSTLAAVVVTASPYPADQRGNQNTNRPRTRPYDWVLADPDLHAAAQAVRIGSSTYPNGLVFDSRVYTPLSEVSPVLYGDSDALNMQHMAVVRDFAVPVAEDDFTYAPETADFGIVDPASGPFTNDDVVLTVVHPFDLTGVTFQGVYANEFALLAPDLASPPVPVDADTPLVFRWSPVGGADVPRNVSADFTTSGSPSTFTILLRGTPRNGGSGGEPIDVGGYRLEQINSAAAVTIPAGTLLDPGGLLVIGRNATRSAFESFWGAMPSQVVYLNGMAEAGGNGFPVINGDEQYRLFDSGGSQIDPGFGYLPEGGMGSGESRERIRTDGLSFGTRAAADATPGAYGGTPAGTGSVLITEISDASGSGNYVYEFIELYYDAARRFPSGLSLY